MNTLHYTFEYWFRNAEEIMLVFLPLGSSGDWPFFLTFGLFVGACWELKTDIAEVCLGAGT